MRSSYIAACIQTHWRWLFSISRTKARRKRQFYASELGKNLLIDDCGEAVPALRPVGILPTVGNKGKMPSPQMLYFFDSIRLILSNSESTRQELRVGDSRSEE